MNASRSISTGLFFVAGVWLALAEGTPTSPADSGPAAVAPSREDTAGVEKADRSAAPQRLTGGRAETAPGPIPPRFEEVFVRISSSGAGRQGIAATLVLPPVARYGTGAPVAINVIGGVLAGTARGRPEYARHGFVQLQFAFPGGGSGEERSGGEYDLRGPRSVRALADVVLFATGRLADSQGRFISELTGKVAALTNNVGLIGASHGGNACIQAIARYGSEFPNLAWYASMESPLGEGAANVEFGGHETGLNPGYDPATGRLDLSHLAWSETLPPGFNGRPLPAASRELSGALYLDCDGDGRFAEGRDFPLNCIVGNAGNGVRAWYSPRLIAEVEKRGLLGPNKPAHLPTLSEVRDFWAWRDGAPLIADTVAKCTNLAVIVYANQRDHVQADPKHTHIHVQIDGFQKARARFLRLNPDRAYVRWVAPGRPWQAFDTEPVDNPADKIWSRESLLGGLEPIEVRMGICMQAAVCELADRSQANTWAPDLEVVLFPQAPRLPAPPPLGATRLGLQKQVLQPRAYAPATPP